MLNRIKNALLIYGAVLPKAIKEIIIDLGQEVDQLKAEMSETRSKIKQLELEKQNATMVHSAGDKRGE